MGMIDIKSGDMVPDRNWRRTVSYPRDPLIHTLVWIGAFVLGPLVAAEGFGVLLIPRGAAWPMVIVGLVLFLAGAITGAVGARRLAQDAEAMR